MSRTGAKAVSIPDGVNASIDGQLVSIKGPKGELSIVLEKDVEVAMTDDGIKVTPRNATKQTRSLWGLSRSLVANLVDGVSQGFEKKLEITGVGYRAQIQGKKLTLQLGLSHDVHYEIPEGIDVKCPSQTEIIITGIDKQKVGQVAAEIRHYKPPEPYKGKGIRYANEYIFRKEGKKK
jgi:large subunit ribosomal protein L6